jgi:hypothetical protein
MTDGQRETAAVIATVARVVKTLGVVPMGELTARLPLEPGITAGIVEVLRTLGWVRVSGNVVHWIH